MRKIIPYILAFIATVNLIWLFAFDYRIPDFVTSAFGNIFHSAPAGEAEQQEENEAAEAAEETEEQTAQEAVQSGQEAAAAEPGAAGNGEGTVPENGQEGMATETAERTCRPTEGNAPNIRSGPGSNNDVIGAAGADEIMTVRGDAENGWLPIRTAAGLEGYVFADLVEIIEPEEPEVQVQ